MVNKVMKKSKITAHETDIQNTDEDSLFTRKFAFYASSAGYISISIQATRND